MNINEIYQTFNFRSMSDDDIAGELVMSETALNDLHNRLLLGVADQETIETLIRKWKARISVLHTAQLERAITNRNPDHIEGR